MQSYDDFVSEMSDCMVESHAPGWDDEGGVPVSQDAWGMLVTLSTRLVILGIFSQYPTVRPCGDGTAHGRWTLPDRVIDAEAHPSGYAWLVRYHDRRDPLVGEGDLNAVMVMFGKQTGKKGLDEL